MRLKKLKRHSTHLVFNLDLVVVANAVFTKKVKLQHVIFHQCQVLYAQAAATNLIVQKEDGKREYGKEKTEWQG